MGPSHKERHWHCFSSHAEASASVLQLLSRLSGSKGRPYNSEFR
uniref:Uncharacterized protein n=1 Tax=Arundo donax TaxID=35708 RepID=A0A0A9FZR4_ARUDO